MKIEEIKAVQGKLRSFLEPFRSLIGRSERMRCCGLYVSGLMLNGDRKSIEPMAKRLGTGEGEAQNLQQFVNQSPWAHKPVIEKLREEMVVHEASGGGVLALDDTANAKKGKHSVGVAPQYCGSLGKIANCQSFVTWHYADAKRHWPLTGELYLPKAWTQDKKRMKKAGVPEERHRFQEKWRLALDLLDEFREKTPHRALVFDSGYGDNRLFLRELDERGELFVGAISGNVGFWPLETPLKTEPNRMGRPRQHPSVKDPKAKARLAQSWLDDPRPWERIRLKTARKSTVEAKAFRVWEVSPESYRRVGPERWLIVERDSAGDIRYYVSNFGPEASLEKMVLTVHQRWMVEQGYQRLKEELGLDHFEGRSWRGLHHHMSLCFMAYDFLVRTGRTLKRTA